MEGMERGRQTGFVMSLGGGRSEAGIRAVCASGLAAAAGAAVFGLNSVWAATPEVLDMGEGVFKAQCAGCHLGGGNIIPIARGKTLKEGALRKYNLYNVESIVNLSKNGKGAMPKFEGKLEDAELESVAEFILQRAQEGWK